MSKTGFYLLTVFMFKLIVTGNAQTTKKMEITFNQQQREVYSTIKKMVTAFENKDIDGVLSTYEKNAIVMFESGKPITGHKALKSAFKEFITFNPSYSFSSHEVYISGNIATHISPWKMTGLLPDGCIIKQSGLSIAILRKQENGNWLMIQDNPHGQFLLKN